MTTKFHKIRTRLLCFVDTSNIHSSLYSSFCTTGDGGLDELTEDFNPSKIQYAFLKVEDPKTSLPKFVLINWQVSLGFEESDQNDFISPISGRDSSWDQEGDLCHASS